MKSKIIVDLDGTLADDSHRSHHLKWKPYDWDAYFSACGDDAPRTDVIEAVQALDMLYNVHILSARCESTLEITKKWLRKHRVRYDSLQLRPEGNRTDDHILKIEWGNALGGPEEVLLVIEDRKRVVDAWRAAGYTCLQCAPGEF